MILKTIGKKYIQKKEILEVEVSKFIGKFLKIKTKNKMVIERDLKVTFFYYYF